MEPRSRVKVLLADNNGGSARPLGRALEADPRLTVTRIGPDEILSEAVAAHAADVVILDLARSDRDVLEGVRQLALRSIGKFSQSERLHRSGCPCRSSAKTRSQNAALSASLM